MARRPYTEDDIATIQRLAAEGRSQSHIARVLKRGIGSISTTLHRRKIRTFGKSGRPYASRGAGE